MNVYSSFESLPLRRTPDRLLGGVCAGLAHRWGIAPILVRILAVVLVPVGGLPILAYGLGWLLIPDYETGRVLLRSSLRDPSPAFAAALAMTLVGLLVALPGSAVFIGGFANGDRFVALITVAALLLAFLLVFRFGHSRPHISNDDAGPARGATNVPGGAGSNAPAAAGPAPQAFEPEPAAPADPLPFSPPKPPAPRLGGRAQLLALAASFLVAAVLLLVVPGSIGRWIAAICGALAALALAMVVAGALGKRAGWVTFFTWILLFPAACGLVLGMVIPSRYVVAPDLKVFSNSDGLAIYNAAHYTVDTPQKLAALPSHIEAVIADGIDLQVAEGLPLIIELRRNEEAYGTNYAFVNGFGSWEIRDAQGLLNKIAEDLPVSSAQSNGWPTASIGEIVPSGKCLKIMTPAAAQDPASARTLTIDFSYGTPQIIGIQSSPEEK